MRYDPSRQWKPQWAYLTPEGQRDEPFFVPFAFQVLANGLLQPGFPWVLDDDVPYLIRGIVFPQIGTAEGRSPALCRIWDTQGNAIGRGSVPPVLALSAWCQSGFNSINAFGFPVEFEVLCAPGGTLVFDFQLPSNAGVASLSYAGPFAVVVFRASVVGAGGNAVTVSLVDSGVPGTPLSVAVAGSAVTVTLGDDGGGALSTTYAQLVSLLNSTPAVAALLSASAAGADVNHVLGSAGIGDGAVHLAGGTASGLVTVQGTLVGVKRFGECP